ncbi:Prephenate dehydrogenase [Candidatus Methanoperedenaceae archaeon GB50]|nr:MAG: Prephenate dehydrogenase [Candidatus Methanoperedenaceae archaeon GB50]CAD7776536.1 Prephenate dehydrogenase [Candidatus Methanoperedenaceae archaeon GB50]
MEILIIGGTGETGQWFARFFKDRGFGVTVWGKNRRLDVAERLGVPFADDLEKAISESDIVMISVPINVTESIIREVAPKMRTGSLLMDVTSIKKGPVDAMERYAPEGVECLGTHPMFGPSIPDIRGQTVILTPTRRCAKWLPIIEEIYTKAGAHIEVITPVEHDEVMRVVQGLTHFAYISIAATLEAINFDVAKSRRFMSPVYEIMLDFVGRILAQNPYLYAMIQTNPHVTDLHEIFIDECRSLSDLIKEGDIEGFVERMKRAARHFANTEAAQRRSEKLINMKIAEYERFLGAVKSDCAVKHLYTGSVHTGTLVEVTPLRITLQKKKRKTHLKIENVKLLTEEEYNDWRRREMARVTKDVSVYIPDGSDPRVIERLIEGLSPEIISVRVIDTYSKSDEGVSITYRLTLLQENQRETLQRVIDLLVGIGCRER